MPPIEPFEDAPPASSELTAYDRAHIKLYMRLLDAAADGAEWTEAVHILFGIDPAESGGAKTGHGSGGIVRPRAE
jgi:hypothetical protein